MVDNNVGQSPLSKTKQVKGSRRLAREKVLQVLVAWDMSGTSLSTLYSNIFTREFNFGEEEEDKTEDTDHSKLWTEEEVFELEADVPIIWKDDELEFGSSLLHYVVDNKTMLNELLLEFAENWELDRIDKIDKYLMHIAIIELLHFSQIPPKVSINEAIDIAKKYSTDKSSIFINGVLDAVLEKLNKEEKIQKVGRGLVNK